MRFSAVKYLAGQEMVHTGNLASKVLLFTQAEAQFVLMIINILC